MIEQNTSLSAVDIKKQKDKELAALKKRVKADIRKLSKLPVELLKKKIILDLLQVHLMLGGAEGMFKFADLSNANKTEFYKMLNSAFRALNSSGPGTPGSDGIQMPSITIVMSDGQKKELSFNIGNKAVIDADIVKEDDNGADSPSNA